MNSTLSRQLELNVNALSRGFRQALRHALKHDPLGTEETSPAWKAVAARQALLQTMLEAVRPFLAVAEPASYATEPLPPANSDAEEAEDEVPPTEEPAVGGPNDVNLAGEEFSAEVPPDVQRVQDKIDSVMTWPTGTHRQREHKRRELKRLHDTLMRRLNQWKAEITATAEAHGIQLPPDLFAMPPA